MNSSKLTASARLFTVAATAAIVLAGCAPVAADPIPVEPAEPVPAEEIPVEPVDDPEDVPSGSADFWLAGLTDFASALSTTVGEWDAQGCSVQAAIDGEFLCTGALTSAAMASMTIDEMFTGVQEQGFTADELDALAPVQDAAAAAAVAAAAWTDAECNWEATPECTGAGEEVLATAVELDAALAEWAS